MVHIFCELQKERKENGDKVNICRHNGLDHSQTDEKYHEYLRNQNILLQDIEEIQDYKDHNEIVEK